MEKYQNYCIFRLLLPLNFYGIMLNRYLQFSEVIIKDDDYKVAE